MHLITSIVYLPRWIMALQMHAVQFAVCGTLHAKSQFTGSPWAKATLSTQAKSQENYTEALQITLGTCIKFILMWIKLFS